MQSTEGAIDHELRQSRLSRFGRMLAAVTLIYAGLNFGAALWLKRLTAPLMVLIVVVIVLLLASRNLTCASPSGFL